MKALAYCVAFSALLMAQDVPTIRYGEPAAHSEQWIRKGQITKSVVFNGISLAASLRDDGDHLAALVAVINDGDRSYDILVANASLRLILAPAEKRLPAIEPEVYISKNARRARIAGAIAAGLDGAQAGMQRPRQDTGTVTDRDTGKVYDVSIQRNDDSAQRAAQDRARIDGQRRESQIQDLAGTVRDSWLYDNTIRPGQSAVGWLLFAREKKRREVTLDILIGGIRYEIPFQFTGKSKTAE